MPGPNEASTAQQPHPRRGPEGKDIGRPWRVILFPGHLPSCTTRVPLKAQASLPPVAERLSTAIMTWQLGQPSPEQLQVGSAGLENADQEFRTSS